MPQVPAAHLLHNRLLASALATRQDLIASCGRRLGTLLLPRCYVPCREHTRPQIEDVLASKLEHYSLSSEAAYPVWQRGATERGRRGVWDSWRLQRRVLEDGKR